MALLARKQPHERRLADDELRLQDAVGQRADNAEADGLLAAWREDEIVAHLQVQRIGERRLVRYGSNRAILEGAIEQTPRVGTILRSVRERRAERESPFADERRLRSDD